MVTSLQVVVNVSRATACKTIWNWKIPYLHFLSVRTTGGDQPMVTSPPLDHDWVVDLSQSHKFTTTTTLNQMGFVFCFVFWLCTRNLLGIALRYWPSVKFGGFLLRKQQNLGFLQFCVGLHFWNPKFSPFRHFFWCFSHLVVDSGTAGSCGGYCLMDGSRKTGWITGR